MLGLEELAAQMEAQAQKYLEAETANHEEGAPKAPSSQLQSAEGKARQAQQHQATVLAKLAQEQAEYEDLQKRLEAKKQSIADTQQEAEQAKTAAEAAEAHRLQLQLQLAAQAAQPEGGEG